MNEPMVTDEVVAAFARDGVVCLRSVLDPGQVTAAAEAIEAVLAAPGPLTQVASAADDPGAFTEDFCRWQEIPQIGQLARYSQVPALAAALMATPQVRFYHDHILVKEGRTRQRTPWHQDQPYYNVDGRGLSLTVHGAPGFGYPTRRRILSLRYLSAGARHAPRPWRTSPPFDLGELPAGAPMDHPLFPVVWPAVSV